MASSYRLDTKIGEFLIRPLKDDPKQYLLFLNDDLINLYSSIMEAKDAITNHHTGWDEWDLMGNGDVLTLIDWKEV